VCRRVWAIWQEEAAANCLLLLPDGPGSPAHMAVWDELEEDVDLVEECGNVRSMRRRNVSLTPSMHNSDASTHFKHTLSHSPLVASFFTPFHPFHSTPLFFVFTSLSTT
jgi:hypothetical protein